MYAFIYFYFIYSEHDSGTALIQNFLCSAISVVYMYGATFSDVDMQIFKKNILLM